ncbi:uracil-DNA glycosylase family protein [Helicobacter sp. 23-1044]
MALQKFIFIANSEVFMSELAQKAKLLKELYLRKMCGEEYYDYSPPPKKIVSEKSKLPLSQIIANCALCELSKSAESKIAGEANNAEICFISLKPILPHSASFEMIENIAKRVFGAESYNILSLIKCATHISPNANHIKICGDYLKTQLKAQDSALCVIFGEEVAHFVLGNDERLENLRGRILSNIRDFIVTFHIGDLLRNERLKKEAMADFKVAKDFLDKGKK